MKIPNISRRQFYPAGREKLHSLGALDLALWDLKGKALDVPVWQLLGGKSRNHVECYATAFPGPRGGTLEDAGRACMDAGFRTYRYSTDNPRQRVVDRFKLVEQMYQDCVLLHKGTGDGGWAIDFHTELDPPDAINLPRCWSPCIPTSARISSAARAFCPMRPSADALACPSRWASSSAINGTSTP